MKKLSLMLFAAAALLFTSCEGPEGPEGPQGPAGPAGDNSNFSTFETTVLAADWGGQPYTEVEVDIITEDVYTDGVVLVYVEDEFSFWNQIPSAWTPIVGFSYTWASDSGGILGLDHDPGVAIDSDWNIRVVTMHARAYDQIDEEIIADYDRLVDYMENK